MKILMVNKYLYPRAGAETYMITVAEQLLAQGHEVSFFGMHHPDNTTIGPTATIPFLEFGRGQSFTSRVGQLTKALSHAAAGDARRALEGYVEHWEPDLIHAHNIYNQLPPSLFRGVSAQVPVVMTLHDYKPVCPNYSLFVGGETCTDCLGGSFLNCVKKRCCHGSLLASTLAAASSAHHRSRGTYSRDYHRFISPSGFVKRRMVEAGFREARIEVINNFAAIPERPTPPGEGLFYGGRLCIEKGVDILLKGYAMLPEPRPKFRIAGDGPLDQELRALSKRLKLETVEWLGRIRPDQVIDELNATAVAAVPSTWFENCSMAIMEALALGRPVLTSSAGGNPDLVRPGVDGEVFEAGSAVAVRDALARLFDPTVSNLEAMGREAREAALERFSPEVHLRQLHGAYVRTEAAFARQHGHIIQPEKVLLS